MTKSPVAVERPGFLIVVLFIAITLTHVIFPLILFTLVQWITGIDMASIVSNIHSSEPEPSHQSILMIVQGVSSLAAFILTPVAILTIFEKVNVSSYLNTQNQKAQAYVILLGLTVSFMFFNAIFIEWNMNITFPEPFQTKARAFEDLAKATTDYLVNFYSLPYFILSLIVVAVIPAIGEELLFRGLIQRYVHCLFGNIHVAIWLSAFIFSAFHMQFFGFLPRMLLGALFGYILFFSGNLWYSIAAHFVNNGFTLSMLYLHQQGLIDYDIENTESIPLQSALIFCIMCIILFYWFVRQFRSGDSLHHG